MLDGAMSIKDPQYKGGCLPLWTISFWARMHVICEEQEMWKQSGKWLTANVDNSAKMTVINECWMVLEGLPWNEPLKIPGGGGVTASLGGLLADKMLMGDLVDMMVEHLALQLRSDCAASETYEIETLGHMDHIKSQWESRNLKPGGNLSPTLTHIEARMKKSPKILLFPIHWSSVSSPLYAAESKSCCSHHVSL